MSDSGEIQAFARRNAQAASVSNRWWESEGTIPAVGQAPPPPPPPADSPSPARRGEGLLLASARERRQLQLELEAARAEIDALHEMLEDLPEIFERKFRQRVQGLVEEQRRLLADNQLLRDRLYALTPATPTASRALPSQTSFSSRDRHPRLRHSLRSALENLLGQVRRPAAAARLSPPDDEQTKAA